jgi:hypothetical protein
MVIHRISFGVPLTALFPHSSSSLIMTNPGPYPFHFHYLDYCQYLLVFVQLPFLPANSLFTIEQPELCLSNHYQSSGENPQQGLYIILRLKCRLLLWPVKPCLLIPILSSPFWLIHCVPDKWNLGCCSTPSSLLLRVPTFIF